MKRLYTPLHKFFTNLPLNRKLFGIVLLCILPMTVASFFGIHLIQSAGNRLLYQAISGSLSYSATDISSRLSQVEALSNAIISNKITTRELITLYEDSSEIAKRNAYSSLSSQLFDYHQSNQTGIINYIALETPYGLISSYETQSNATPYYVRTKVVSAANDRSGYACWVTDFAADYGLFLGRDSRRINQMKIETLGTLVIDIDMERLLRLSAQSILLSDTAYFAFYQNDQLIYASEGLQLDENFAGLEALGGSYGTLQHNSKSYFALRGTLDNMGWEYICMIPYDNIASSLRISLAVSFGIVLLVAAVAIFLCQWIVRSLTGHFSQLVYKMKAFGKDESVLPVTEYDYSSRQDEIGLLHNQFDGMAQKIRQLIQENYVNEILSKDAKLKALENQINPHFLYNTLESVNWRAKASGEEEISTMVEALGALLRTTLSHKSTTCELSHELEIVRNYIAIQKLRFEERLIYRESIDPDTLTAELPQLTIQPLVENAINYVLEEITEACEIEVRSTADADCIRIQVINTGSQFQDGMLEKLESGVIVPHGFGIGLLNIHKRIQLIYGQTYGLSFFNSDEDHAVAQIRIPRRDLCSNC